MAGVGEGTLICLSGEQDGVGKTGERKEEERGKGEHDDGDQETGGGWSDRAEETRKKSAREGRARWKT